MRIRPIGQGSVWVGLVCVLLIAGCAKKVPPVVSDTSGTETISTSETPGMSSQESEAEAAARRERELQAAIEERERAVVEESMRRQMGTSEPAMPVTTMSQEEFLSQDVHFAYDSYTLSEEAKSVLGQKAAWLKENDLVPARIEGHCDERGTTAYNLALGERRANAVKAYLVALGIDPSRLSTISYGEEFPLDPGHHEEAWARNRRAHFVINQQ